MPSDFCSISEECPHTCVCVLQSTLGSTVHSYQTQMIEIGHALFTCVIRPPVGAMCACLTAFQQIRSCAAYMYQTLLHTQPSAVTPYWDCNRRVIAENVYADFIAYRNDYFCYQASKFCPLLNLFTHKFTNFH